MGFATWFSLRREKRGGEWMKPARWAMVIGLGYIGANWLYSASTSYFSTSDYGYGPRATVIVSPLPLSFWQRELLSKQPGEPWNATVHTFADGAPPPRPLSRGNCALGNVAADAQTEAFLFWSRAPFAERAPDGSVILRDARFYDPRARDRFSVALPDVKCEPLKPEV